MNRQIQLLLLSLHFLVNFAAVKAPLPLGSTLPTNQSQYLGFKNSHPNVGAGLSSKKILTQKTQVAVGEKTISVEKTEAIAHQLKVDDSTAPKLDMLIKKAEPNGIAQESIEKMSILEDKKGIMEEEKEEAERNRLDTKLYRMLDPFSGKIGLPAPFVAKIALKMYNALASYMIANNIGNKSNNFALEMRNLVTVRNFLVNDRAGQLNIRFYGECQLGKLTDLAFRDVVQMSPEQLKDMRIQSNEKDLVWLFGSVIHLMIYQKYPLEEWEAQMLEGKFNLGKFASKQGCGQRYLAELQKEVTQLLESGQSFPINTDVPEKHYECLINLMQECLKTNPDERISFDDFGRRIHRIVVGFNQPNQWQ